MNPSKQKASANENDEIINRTLTREQQINIDTPNSKTQSHGFYLTASELSLITTTWNCSEISYPADKCLHQLFEEQVLKTPEAIALVFEDKELTYAELNERANRLAYYLCSKGVTKETLVPLCISRSVEMIVGILAILKAGGAYVPVDPAYPSERIAYMLEDTNAAIVLCDEKSKTQLNVFKNIELVELSDEASFLKEQLACNLNAVASSENLAYVIYTSGSTGKPKGVMIEHRALADHCYGVIESAGLSSCKSFALFSPLVFDAGHSIIHSAFILGASLHVLSDELILNSDKLKTYLHHNSIDCIKIVPSLWLSYSNLNNPVLSKKVMIFGGEAFHLGILNYLTKSGYHGNVYNHYGPTEVTIGKCIYKVDIHKNYHNVPIGKPFSNTQVFIFDDHLQLTPIGIEGELYIAGDGLARGYLNQPGLTTDKFISNPFTEGRMYKTGDIARWLPDGNIEYMGRADEQVKIRGHRIELGEIEEALLQSDLVRQAVVLANADKNDQKRLVGYIVPSKNFNTEAIIAFLRKKLPEFMIPVTWIELEKLPLTQNGKIDKKELENLERKSRKYVPPQNAVQEELTTIWQDLLKTPRIGIEDDFFELGGNSILAVILFTRIKRKFHKDFPLATIFSTRTISQLATVLNATTEVVPSSSLVAIQPNGFKTPFFVVHAGLGDVVFYQSLSKNLGDDQPLYALQAKGLNGLEFPSTKMEQMASYYISEIRKVQPEGPYYLAGYCLGARIAFEMAQQLIFEGQRIALLANFNGISGVYLPPAHPIRKELSVKEKVLYKLRTTYHLLKKLPFWSMYKLNEIVFRLYFNNKLRVPRIVAKLKVIKSLKQLQHNYKLKSYPGSMLIFSSPGIFGDPYLGWKDLVKGEIKTVDVPGVHKTRRDIMDEPHVQFLARQLENFLD